MSPVPLPVTAPLPAGFRGFVAGISAFLVGLKLVLPGGGLFRYALAPIFVSALVLAGVAVGSFFAVKYWLVEWLDTSWVGWLGGVLAFLLTALVAYFMFGPVMTLFAPLFIDPICEKVHVRYTGRDLVGPMSAQAFLKRQLFAILQSIKWTLVVLFVQLPLAVLALLTVVFAVVAIPINAIIQGADLMDYPLAMRHVTFSGKLKWTRHHFWPCTGMGTAASLMMFVPILNLLVAPAGAAAATILMLAAEGGTGKSPEHP